DIDLHKRIIEGYEREIERAKKYLARYQKAQEFRKNAGDMAELKAQFHATLSNTQEKLRSDAYNTIAKAIKYREEYYYKNLEAAKEIGVKLDEHIGIEGLLEGFYPNLSPRLAKLNSLIKKIEKIDPQGVTPKMRQDLAHMQELSAQQEKELLEIKNLYEKLIAKWEKMHGQKANAVFPAKYTP
ncbi:hypothetical protein, partial [Helicobacter sp. L8]|uniref:hypothetical protein n=1 Tax=Helicobacter sp. L8 TaxID=2316078 RepID=UPI0013CE102B